MVDRDHAELPDRSLSYHPATIALPALASGRLLSATRSGIGWICAAPCGVLASARLVDLRAIPIIPLQSYESDCWLVNESTQRLSYDRAASRRAVRLCNQVTGGAQAAPLRGNSATELLLDPWLTASHTRSGIGWIYAVPRCACKREAG